MPQDTLWNDKYCIIMANISDLESKEKYSLNSYLNKTV